MRESVLVALILVPGWAAAGQGDIHEAAALPAGVPETVYTYFQQVEGHRFDEFLHGIRPSRLSSDAKERMLKILPRADVIDASPRQQAKLRVLAPVLRYHDRESVIDLKVLRAQPAAVAFLGGAAILITEPALGVLSAEELQAAVAHELGHEYFWDEFELARQQAHYAKMQELELRCDGIAVITLDRLHLDPEVLIRTIRKLNRYNGHRDTDAILQRYVTAEQREKFVRSMIGMVRGGQAPDRPLQPSSRVRARY